MRILNEHGPKDIINAYKDEYDYQYKDLDYENSEFQDVSVKDALKLIKEKNSKDLHLLVDGKLIVLDEKGRPNKDLDVSDDKVYTKRSGAVVTELAKMPTSHLVKIADKIFIPNLKKIDRARYRDRAENRQNIDHTYNDSSFWYKNAGESRGWKVSPYDASNWDLMKTPADTLYRKNAVKEVQAYYDKLIQNRQESIDRFTKKRQDAMLRLDGTTDEEQRKELQRIINRCDDDIQTEKLDILRLKYKLRQSISVAKDSQAALRYADSARYLQDDLQRKQDLVQQAADLQGDIANSTKQIDFIKQHGAPTTQASNARLNIALAQLKDLNSQLTKVMNFLDNADDYDTQALDKLADEQNQIQSEYDEVKQVVDKFAAIKAHRGG